MDNRPQPRYPFEFHQADALEYVREHGHEFDAVHASPPCQYNTSLRALHQEREYEDLIPDTRAALQHTSLPYVIENVPGARSLRATFLLCGTMFGLRTQCGAELWRHRYFEANWDIGMVPVCQHRSWSAGNTIGVHGGGQHPNGRRVIGVYGGHGRDRRRVCTVAGHSGGRSDRDGTQQFSTEARRQAMGIDWMTQAELSQAIPPAYTEFIGRTLLQHIRAMTDAAERPPGA